MTLPITNCARLKRGVISYVGGDGRQTGRERFELIDDGQGIVMRAFCEMDEAGLTRDVTLRMDRDWRPADGFCRIVHADGRTAAMWFDVGKDHVRLDSSLDGTRLDAQTLPIDQPLAYLGLHPLQGDALIVNLRGTDRTGEFDAIPCVTNSISPNGDEAVGLRRVTIKVAFMGHATIAVPAGTFAARHYALRWSPEWPPADLWVREADCIFLRMTWSFIEDSYELTELHEG
jgi:hypothetical protein